MWQLNMKNFSNTFGIPWKKLLGTTRWKNNVCIISKGYISNVYIIYRFVSYIHLDSLSYFSYETHGTVGTCYLAIPSVHGNILRIFWWALYMICRICTYEVTLKKYFNNNMYTTIKNILLANIAHREQSKWIFWYVPVIETENFMFTIVYNKCLIVQFSG